MASAFCPSGLGSRWLSRANSTSGSAFEPGVSGGDWARSLAAKTTAARTGMTTDVEGNRIPQLEANCVRDLHSRAPSLRTAPRILHRPSFRIDLRQAGAAFYFHDLVAQESGALEFQIRRGVLHFLFQLAQKLREIEIAAALLNHGGRDLPAAQNRVETFLHRTPHGLRRDPVLLVVFHLLGPPIIGDRHQGLHAL